MISSPFGFRFIGYHCQRYTRPKFPCLLSVESSFSLLFLALNASTRERADCVTVVAFDANRKCRLYVARMLQCSFLERDRVSRGLTYIPVSIYPRLAESDKSSLEKILSAAGFNGGERGREAEHSGNPRDIKEPINVKRQRVSSYLVGRRISARWARARFFRDSCTTSMQSEKHSCNAFNVYFAPEAASDSDTFSTPVDGEENDGNSCSSRSSAFELNDRVEIHLSRALSRNVLTYACSDRTFTNNGGVGTAAARD